MFAGFAFAAWGATVGAVAVYLTSGSDILRFGAAWVAAACAALALGASIGAYVARIESELD
jgi:hypothetical protein